MNPSSEENVYHSLIFYWSDGFQQLGLNVMIMYPDPQPCCLFSIIGYETLDTDISIHYCSTFYGLRTTSKSSRAVDPGILAFKNAIKSHLWYFINGSVSFPFFKRPDLSFKKDWSSANNWKYFFFCSIEIDYNKNENILVGMHYTYMGITEDSETMFLSVKHQNAN